MSKTGYIGIAILAVIAAALWFMYVRGVNLVTPKNTDIAPMPGQGENGLTPPDITTLPGAPQTNWYPPGTLDPDVITLRETFEPKSYTGITPLIRGSIEPTVTTFLPETFAPRTNVYTDALSPMYKVRV